jgi:hypothetical protein
LFFVNIFGHLSINQGCFRTFLSGASSFLSRSANSLTLKFSSKPTLQKFPATPQQGHFLFTLFPHSYNQKRSIGSCIFKFSNHLIFKLIPTFPHSHIPTSPHPKIFTSSNSKIQNPQSEILMRRKPIIPRIHFHLHRHIKR